MGDVVEHWTDSGRGLVVTGSHLEVMEVTQAVGLPDSAPVKVAQRRWAVAVWGEAVPKYLQHRRGSFRSPLVCREEGNKLQSDRIIQ